MGGVRGKFIKVADLVRRMEIGVGPGHGGLLDVIPSCIAGYMDKREASRNVSIGKILNNRRGRRFGAYRLESKSGPGGIKNWGVVREFRLG